jgi:hypothetical protein
MAVDYKIHTKSQGTITAEANLDSPNAQVVGQTDRYEFWLQSYYDSKLYQEETTITSSETVSYGEIIVESGVTLTVNGTIKTHNLTVNGDVIVNGTIIVIEDGDNELSKLLKYAEWAGKYDTKKMLNGTLKYSDRIPSAEVLESLVVGIEPATELQNKDVKGVWGLIDSIEDNRNAVLTPNRIIISLTNLGEFEDYKNVEDIENTLKL